MIDAHNFRQIYPHLKKIGEIHAIEAPLFFKPLRVAGRTDLIAEYESELAIIDFKNSTNIKEEHYIKDYFIQETFYGVAYSSMYGIPVTKIVTIIACKNSDNAQVFVKEPVNYVEALVERVNKFYKENE
jgi:genome maintenance exonuclease 1